MTNQNAVMADEKYGTFSYSLRLNDDLINFHQNVGIWSFPYQLLQCVVDVTWVTDRNVLYICLKSTVKLLFDLASLKRCNLFVYLSSYIVSYGCNMSDRPKRSVRLFTTNALTINWSFITKTMKFVLLWINFHRLLWVYRKWHTKTYCTFVCSQRSNNYSIFCH